MSDAPARSRGHRHQAESYRRAVTWYLLGSGLSVQQRETSPERLDEAVGAGTESSDIQGLTEFAVTTSAAHHIDVSSRLDRAVEAAVRDRKPWAAAVHYRRGRSAGEGYVFMRLQDFAEVLRRLEGLPD